MKEFLAEFWLWILIPGLVVAAGILWLVLGADSEQRFYSAEERRMLTPLLNQLALMHSS